MFEHLTEVESYVGLVHYGGHAIPIGYDIEESIFNRLHVPCVESLPIFFDVEFIDDEV